MIFLANKIVAVGVIIMVLVVAISLVVFFIWMYRKGEDKTLKSQDILSDQKLLELIDQEPDKVMTIKRLVEKSGLDKKQASNRLTVFVNLGILKMYYNSKFQYFYSLREEIEEKPAPELSKEVFLTIGDIITLFKHFDFRLSYQKICIATGLPIVIIKEEMDYFIKEKIVTQVLETTADGMHRRLFFLEEPYRSKPDEYLDLEEQVNLDLEKIYVKEMGDKT